MLFVYFISFLFIFNCVTCDTAIDEPLLDNGVFVLNKNNFDRFISENNVAMVEFYAPWCGHCKTLEPVYSAAAQELSKNVPKIPLAKVDATVETDLANRFDVNGYPTLKYFKDGKHYDYEAERSSKGIVEFLKRVNSADWKPPKSHVITLTKTNFADVIASSEYILVEFFAPWCGHCKSLAPEYAKAASTLSKLVPPIPLAAVDATQETELAKEYNVTGYPTLKLFRNGKARDYNGPRYSDGIVEWMLKNRENAAKEVQSLHELNKMKDPEKASVLGLFQSKDDTLYPLFIDATNRMRDEIISAVTFSDDFRAPFLQFRMDTYGSILVLKPEYFHNRFEPQHVKYVNTDNLDPTVDKVVSFIEKEMLPLVGEYNSNTSPIYEQYHKEYLCLFFYTVDFSVHHRAATKMWLNKIVEIAAKFQEKIQFSIADDEKQSGKLKELRLDDSGEDMNVGCISRDKVKYRMSIMEEFDSAHIENFLKDMLDGKLFPLLRSSTTPRSPPSLLRPVVGDTYRALVDDSARDGLLLLFRGPCQACEGVRAVLLRVAAVANDTIDFFSIDVGQNDLPPAAGLETVDGRPSLYLATAVAAPGDGGGLAVLKKRLVRFQGDVLVEAEVRAFLVGRSAATKDEL